MLNIIWTGFFLFAFLVAIIQTCNGNTDVWNNIFNSIFTSADNGFRIALGLTGVLCFWMGMLKIAEKSGLTDLLAKTIKPFLRAIMPDVPVNSPAFGSITMNIAANVLGLDNAATPMGLKAIEQLQECNPHKDKASKAQIMFMVLNSSSLTLIPITIMMYRFQAGSTNPAAVFIPILLATGISTYAGLLATLIWQRINIFKPIILAYLLAGLAIIGGGSWCFAAMRGEVGVDCSLFVSNFILFALVILFLLGGIIKKQNIYETFIEGAKDGFKIAVQIIPYLVAMLAAIGVFRASGGFDYLCGGIVKLLNLCHINADFAAVIPTALMKPLSGSGARAMMLDVFGEYGVDSFAGFAASIIQGSTETTFYVLAVYFGAVKISKTGAALPLALFADVCGMVAAIGLAYVFYGG